MEGEEDINELNRDEEFVGGFVPWPIYNQLYAMHINLQHDFDVICNKYKIGKCSFCNKYRRESMSCACGKIFCTKCRPEDYGGSITMRCCDKCNRLTCANCSLDTCSVCDKNVCKRQGCIAFICDGLLTGECRNIVCCENRCDACGRLYCNKCLTSHNPCRPIRCSCGKIVYQNKELQQNDANFRHYQVIECKVCGKLSCAACARSGLIHRANHSIIPFLIACRRGDLPVHLPDEIILAIWECMIN